MVSSVHGALFESHGDGRYQTIGETRHGLESPRRGGCIVQLKIFPQAHVKEARNLFLIPKRCDNDQSNVKVLRWIGGRARSF